MAREFTVERQVKSRWCWAAVTAAVHGYFQSGDERLSQPEVVTRVLGERCRLNPDGCNRGFSLLEALKKPEIDVAARREDSHITFDRIKTEIDARRPIGVRVRWRNTRNLGHFVVIYGYREADDGRKIVAVADPVGRSFIMDYERLKTAYRVAGEWTHTYLMGAKK